jgi:enolase
MKNSTIMSIKAWEGLSDYMTPAVNVSVVTAAGPRADASYAEGISHGSYYGYHLYDGGKRFDGKGVSSAVALINNVLAPALVGEDVLKQGIVDGIIKEVLEAEMETPAVNVSSPVSFAVLKAGAASLDMPLFSYIGGSFSAKIPVPGFLNASGSSRYGEHSPAQGKPHYAFVAYDFADNNEADYALWEVENLWEESMGREYGVKPHRGFSMAIPKGRVKNDGQLWELMARCIEKAGYTGKVGLHADLAATAFFDPETKSYAGLYDENRRDREQMISLAIDMAKNYPFVILQDPLEQNDSDGFAEITRSVDIQVAGSDIIGTDLERLRSLGSAGCFNTAVLRVQKYPTFSDCVRAVSICGQLGIGVMPWDSAGEDMDIIHYAVGFRCGSVSMAGLSSHGNKMALIEEEIGPRVSFFGKHGLKGGRFSLAAARD